MDKIRAGLTGFRSDLKPKTLTRVAQAIMTTDTRPKYASRRIGSATIAGIAKGAGMIEPLKVSYRSTAEITEFSRNILGSLAHEAEPISTRHGPPVELFEFASPGEAVAFLADALRTLAREKELGQLKSNFVSMVSHEFRTPLGIIQSSAELWRLIRWRNSCERATSWSRVRA